MLSSRLKDWRKKSLSHSDTPPINTFVRQAFTTLLPKLASNSCCQMILLPLSSTGLYYSIHFPEILSKVE